jgi:hypothetical protein
MEQVRHQQDILRPLARRAFPRQPLPDASAEGLLEVAAPIIHDGSPLPVFHWTFWDSLTLAAIEEWSITGPQERLTFTLR